MAEIVPITRGMKCKNGRDRATINKMLSNQLRYKHDTTVPGEPKGSKGKQWEQWCGLVERGNRRSLKLWRLDKPQTGTRAPGPGPISSKEWRPICEASLIGRNVILHTDGAKAYRMGGRQPPGIVHDRVVHKKERVMNEDGAVYWKLPKYVTLKTHRLPGGALE